MLEVQPDFVGQECEGFVCAFGFFVVFFGVFSFLKRPSGSEEVEAEQCKLAAFTEVVGQGD